MPWHLLHCGDSTIGHILLDFGTLIMCLAVTVDNIGNRIQRKYISLLKMGYQNDHKRYTCNLEVQ